MSDGWQYQMRIDLAAGLGEIARRDPGNPALEPLMDILARHDAIAKCQFDAFADYVAEAERHGIECYPLYQWTKATIEDPVKKAKHLESFRACLTDFPCRLLKAFKMRLGCGQTKTVRNTRLMGDAIRATCGMG